MSFICESSLLEDYLCEDEIVDYSHPLVQETIRQLHTASDPETERVRKTFEFVRDSIHHSWDIGSPHVTCKASEVLSYREGLCYAKSHLLAALLRAQRIPTGFCYQRVTLGETAEMGHVLHGLNAVYLLRAARWVRLDARGNKPGIQAEFSTEQERVAYIMRPGLGEIDYPTIYARPHPKVVKVLQGHIDGHHLCLPDQL
jgi:transglutaminase-like putative cysteine protease